MASGASKPEVPQPQKHRLGEQLYAEGNQLLSTARHRLQQDLIEFLRKTKNGGEEELGRNPESGDLTPFFQRYAWSLIEARYKEEILAKPSIDAANQLIRFSIEHLVDKICSVKAKNKKQIPAMIWARTVNLACRGVGLKSRKTRFGVYGPSTFMTPQQEQLHALLLLQSRELQAEFWRRRAIAAESSDENRAENTAGVDVEINGPYRKRALWLRDQMAKKGWGTTNLSKHNGPTEKTTNSVLQGRRALQTTITALAKAFNVPPSSIPNS